MFGDFFSETSIIIIEYFQTSHNGCVSDNTRVMIHGAFLSKASQSAIIIDNKKISTMVI